MPDNIITKKQLPRLISESSKNLKKLEVLALEKVKPILSALREKDHELLNKELGMREVYYAHTYRAISIDYLEPIIDQIIELNMLRYTLSLYLIENKELNDKQREQIELMGADAFGKVRHYSKTEELQALKWCKEKLGVTSEELILFAKDVNIDETKLKIFKLI